MLGEPLHSLGVWLKFVTLLLNYGNFSGTWGGGFIGVIYTVKLLLRLLCWFAALGVGSVIRRHQPPQRTVLGQVNCFDQCEVVDSQIMLDGVQPRDTRTLPVIWWESC